jgi:hypothetical protein
MIEKEMQALERIKAKQVITYFNLSLHFSKKK